jgi:predicted RNase H-like nuclease (RuvC/YqgF family)
VPVNDMDDLGSEGIRDRISARTGEGALGELAQFLIDNPWIHQALQVALGARERASQAGTAAIRNLNLPTGNDVDRLARRVRALSERLEEVEDTLDQLSQELAAVRRERGSSHPPTSGQG